MAEVGDAPVVALIAERRHLENTALTEARADLEAQGCKVVTVVPDDQQLYSVPDRSQEWSIAVSRGRDLAGLGLLSAAAAFDIPTINHPQAIELVRNKISMQAVLAEHDLPLPRTWFAHDPAAFAGLPRRQFPLVVKPFDGDGSSGLALLTGPKDVDLLPPPPSRYGLYLAQEMLETDGYDLKLYGIGSRVWAVRKRSPVRLDGPGPAGPTEPEPARLQEVDSTLRDIALTCGRACRLDLWGVDVAVTPTGPVVIEVNDFPTYSAVPGAGAAIATQVLATLRMHQVAAQAGRSNLAAVIREPS